MDIELIVKYSKGRCTEAEKAFVENLINASEEVSLQVQKYQRLYALQKDIEGIEVFDEYAAFAQLRNQLSEKVKVKKSFTQTFMRLAAILLLPLIVVSVAGYLYFNDQTKWVEITANSEKVLKHTMPDNTTIWLQRGSTLRYTENYSSNRRVKLIDGEAFFEVESDEENPFYVDTESGISLYVYGTEFNIRSYDDDSTVRTILKQGRLNLILSNSTISVQEGQEVVYDKNSNTIEKKDADIEKTVAWKDGTLIFRDVTIDELLAELSIYYNIEIKSVKHNDTKYMFRATFKDETLEKVLEYLSQSASIKWEIKRSSDKQVKDILVIHIY